MALIVPRNWCLIFFRDPQAQFTPTRLKQVLEAAHLTVTGDEQPFPVRWLRPDAVCAIQRSSHIGTVIAVVGHAQGACSPGAYADQVSCPT